MKKFRSDPPVTADKARAKRVLAPVYWTYMEQKMLFAHVTREADAPQQRFSPYGVTKGSVKHRLYLFFAAMTDRREVSDRVYESHTRLWLKEPRLYSREVLDIPQTDITRLLAGEKVGSPAQSARYWPRSAKTLFSVFAGDPLEMYRRFDSVGDILLFKKRGGDLPGFGPKILSLLALFYEELGLLTAPRDAFPVDVHIQRFAISTGIVTAEGRVTNEDVESVLRPLLCEICTEERWEPLELSHALWFLGNRCCSGCHRNAAMELLCPSYEECKGGISTLSYNRNGVWDMAAPRYRKGGSRTLSFPFAETPLFLAPASHP